MLAKSHRLPSPNIRDVMKTGRRIAIPEFQLVYRFPVNSGNQKEDSRNLNNSRFAFVVSVKVDKRATVRNRIRRILSESVRHLLPGMKQNVDGIFFARMNISGRPQDAVEELVTSLLKRSGLL